MGSANRANMLSRLIALAVLTCLAWSTSASVLDAVVPEDMLENSPSATPSRLPPLALIATDAITTELATMKKHAPSDAGVAQIEGMIQMMNKESADPASSHRCDAKIPADQATCSAQTTKSGCESVVDSDTNEKCTYQMDGGTKDMEDLLTSAKTTINAAVTTMLSGLETAYANAKLDLQAMDTAIDNSKQTISPTELEAIKTKATTWCSKKRALKTATSDASTAASALTTKLNEPLGLSDVLVKEVGTIGPSDCSQANSDAKDSTCSPGSPNLASRIQTKIDTVRGEYLAASWDKFEKDALETTATTEEGASKDAFQDIVTVTASTYHSMCGSSDQVHNTAVTLFNGNNAGRSAMYRSLGVILCHINHMSSGQTFTVPTNLLKSGEANPTTSATDCNGKLKADSTIKTELFPDATSNEDSNKACPALSAYEDDIRNYGSLGFDKDEADWSATTTKCDAVTAAAGPSPPPAPAPLPPIAAPTVCGGDIGNNMHTWAQRTPANCDTISGDVNLGHGSQFPDDLTELSFPGLVTVGSWVHFYMKADRITKIDLPDLRSANTIRVENLPNLREVNMPVVETITTNNAEFYNLPSLTDQTFLSSGICASPIGRSGALGQMQSPSEAPGSAETLTCPQY